MPSLRAYLYRGAHRAGRFSVRVADIQAALAAEKRPRWRRVVRDGREFMECAMPVRFWGLRPGEQVVLTVAPSQGLGALPAVVEVAP